ASDDFGLGVVAIQVLLGRAITLADIHSHDARVRDPNTERRGPTDPLFQKLSMPAKETVLGLIEADPRRRLTAARVMTGEWLRMWEVEFAGPVVHDVPDANALVG
ncbi:hypothetical protein HK405_006540, partial [Cladochytrium tenue]